MNIVLNVLSGVTILVLFAGAFFWWGKQSTGDDRRFGRNLFLGSLAFMVVVLWPMAESLKSPEEKRCERLYPRESYGVGEKNVRELDIRNCVRYGHTSSYRD